MKRPERTERRSAFRKDESALRAIVRDLGPMDPDGLPEDEYDCLVHHLLSALHRGVTREGLGREIESHLEGHFGFDTRVSSESADWIASATWSWWSSRRAGGQADA